MLQLMKRKQSYLRPLCNVRYSLVRALETCCLQCNAIDGGVRSMHSVVSVHAEKYRMAGAGWRLPGDETSIHKVAWLVLEKHQYNLQNL